MDLEVRVLWDVGFRRGLGFRVWGLGFINPFSRNRDSNKDPNI